MNEISTYKRFAHGCVQFMYDRVPSVLRTLRYGRPPEWLWRHWYFKGVIDIKVTPRACFKAYHYGHRIENDLFWAGYGRGWEATSLELWRRLAPMSATILDIGSNSGVYALAAAALNPAAQVYAFEPVRNNHAKLLRNIALNGFRISAECIALSDKSGEALIFGAEGEQPVSASLEPVNSEANRRKGSHRVRTMRLDEYLNFSSADMPVLMKIDVERHELAVLRGFGGLLRQSKPTILIEILSNAAAEQIEGFVRELEYQKYEVVEGIGLVRIKTLSERHGENRNFLLCQSDMARGISLDDMVVTVPLAEHP